MDDFDSEVELALAVNSMSQNEVCGDILNALEEPARLRVLMFLHDMIDRPKKILDVLVEAYGKGIFISSFTCLF